MGNKTIPAASNIETITDKERDNKIARLTNKINKKRKTFARLQQKEKRLKLELADLNFDLNELIKKGS